MHDASHQKAHTNGRKALILSGPRQMLYDWSTYRKNQKSIAELEKHLRTKGPTLLVHQMGRAGSMTTVSTLRNASLGMPVFHTHWLNTRNIAKRLNRFAGAPDRKLPFNVRVGIRISQELGRHGRDYRPWHLVTVFREPVARNLSVYFLSIVDYIPDFFRRHASGELTNNEILDVFLRKFPHDEPLDWFNEEVLEIFGIDVFEYPFPVEHGYQVIREEGFSMLLIKVEELNDCFARAFEEFFDVRISTLDQKHITERDPSYGMYQRFLKDVRLPDEYLTRMYDSRFARHFYSPAEIERFKRRWSKVDQALSS